MVCPSTRVQVHSMVGMGNPFASQRTATFDPVVFFVFSGGLIITGANNGKKMTTTDFYND